MKLWRKLLWLGALTGVSSALLLGLSTSKGETKKKNENGATIISTASLRGEVSPCG